MATIKKNETPSTEETDLHALGPYGMFCPIHPDLRVVPSYFCPVTGDKVEAVLPHVGDADPPLPCSYHPKEKEGTRCGAPTIQIMVGGGLEGMWYLPICPDCAAEATIEGTHFIFAHRFGAMPEDMPLS